MRELNEVSARGVVIHLASLFPARSTFAHAAADRWLETPHRPRPAQSVLEFARWAWRSPAAVAGAVGRVAVLYRRKPALLLRALATLGPASVHARMVERESVGHIHAHYATYPALAAWFAHRLTGVTYSFTAHAHDLFVDHEPLVELAAHAAMITPISDFNRRFIAERLQGRTPPPMHVIHCGVDVSNYLFRPRCAVVNRPRRLLCVASLQEYKGHETLLAALAILKAELGDFRLDLVGEGPLRAHLEALAGRLGLASRVRFRGVLEENDVRVALADADIFVLASVVARDGQMEGIPVALMEAMATGVPVVSTRLSGIPELIEHGRTGLLAEPGDAPSLATQIRQVIRAPQAARSRAAAAREHIEQQFDLASECRTLADLLKRLALERP